MQTRIEGDYRITETDSGAVIQELNRPAPQAALYISKLAFRDRFTAAEKIAIYTAAATVVQIRIWLDDLAAVAEVSLSDPRTIAGVQGLEDAGLIAAGRAAEILGG